MIQLPLHFRICVLHLTSLTHGGCRLQYKANLNIQLSINQTVETAYSEFIQKSKKANWKMSYFDNKHVTATDICPTFAGFHRNQGRRDSELFHGCWTMRFGDGLYYVMVPASRHKGVLPTDKAGRLVLRCNHKNSKCKARTLLALDDEAIAAIKRNDYEWLRANPQTMKIIVNVLRVTLYQ